MAEGSPSPGGATPAPLPPGAPPASPGQAPARPDWVPDQYWNTQKGEVDIQGLASGYKDLSSRFAKGKEALVPEIKTEVMKEIFGKRPEKPELYKFDSPKEGPLAERLSKNNLVVLTQKPGPDFQREQGKEYYFLNTEGDRFKLGQELAHKSGMSNDEFMDLAVRFVEIEAKDKASNEKKVSEQVAENRKLLGENADKRIEYLKGKINTIAGDKASASLDLDYLPASAVEVLEKILEKGGEPKFSMGTGGEGKKDAGELRAEMTRLQIEKDYYESPSKQKRAAEIARQISQIEGPHRFKPKP